MNMIPIERKLNKYDLFDNSILEHGFLNNNRDYEIRAELFQEDIQGEYKYEFIGCVEIQYNCEISSDSFLVDSNFDNNFSNNVESGNYIWTEYAEVYPGWEFFDSNKKIKEYKEKYGLDFYQITIKTNVYTLALIFHDLKIYKL